MEKVKSRPPIDRLSKTPTPLQTDSDLSSDLNSSQDINDSPVYQKESNSTTVEKDQQNNRFGVLSIVSAIAFLLVVFHLLPERNPDTKSCSFIGFEKKYPQNKNAWMSLSAGIENIINGKKDAPAVYLFLHNNGIPFNKKIFDIAQQASLCFGGEKKPVQMDSADFTSEEALKDFGNVIVKYKKKIKEGNVVLIVNLNEIPAEAARALHTICDTHNPIVKNVVILMTLNSEESGDNVVEAAENTLYELWGSKMERNSLDPLVARLIDQVIALQ